MHPAGRAAGEDARSRRASYERLSTPRGAPHLCRHKLIATPAGDGVLSKENDSNGSIGTVDVSYPSIPIFLKYCPELVNALCRPV
ncbi:MAG: glutaminase domain-containing protein [Eubacteriales bacterium]